MRSPWTAFLRHFLGTSFITRSWDSPKVGEIVENILKSPFIAINPHQNTIKTPLKHR